MSDTPRLETWIVWLTYAPLLTASVVGLALTLIKAMEFRRAATFSDHDRTHLLRLVAADDLAGAITAAESMPAPAGLVVATLARQGRTAPALVRDRAALTVAHIVRELETGLSGLALVAALGPLFGLFGTVVGISLVFNRLASLDAAGGPERLAGGISTALYTTIVGLIVGVLALVSHRYFTARLDRLTTQLEALALDVVERMAERRP